MGESHKHKGVENRGVPKLHPVDRVHKETEVMKYHNAELKGTKPAARAPASQPSKNTKHEADLRMLKDTEVNNLKGRKLVEVRRFSVAPIFIQVTKTESIEKSLQTADIPTDGDEELKIEGIKYGTKTWVVVKLSDKTYNFDRIALTTKVDGN